MSTAAAIQSNHALKRKTRKAGKLISVSIPKIEKSEVLKAMGWSEIPETLLSAIDTDLKLFMNEHKFNYSTVDEDLRERRSRIQYWINNYKEGICSLETAKSVLMK